MRGELKIAGIYRLGEDLLVDPSCAVFPMRCIYTNEPVAELTPMKLASVEAIAGVMIIKKSYVMNLPISDTWRRRKIRFWLLIARTFKWGGWFTVILGPSLSYCFRDDVKTSVNYFVLGIVSTIFLWILSYCIPYLEDTTDVNCIYRVKFYSDGRVCIPWVGRRLLEVLNMAKRGFLHGLMGNEEFVVHPSPKRFGPEIDQRR